MPYRRRRRNKNRSRVPRVRSSRPLTRTLGFRNAVKAVVNRQAETLIHRVNEEASAVPSTGQLVELNSVDSQGVQVGQFTGNEIRQMFLSIRGKVQQSDSSNVCRMVLFSPTAQGIQQLSAGANLSEFFYQPSRAIYSAWNPTMVDKIYRDKLMVLNNASGQNDDIRLIKINQRLGGKKYSFNQPNPLGVQPSGSNVIYLGFLSDSDFGSHPGVEFESILYYKDS